MHQTCFNFNPVCKPTPSWPFTDSTMNKPNPLSVYAHPNKKYLEAALTRAKQHRLMGELERADLLEQAKEEGIGIVHVYSPEFPKGGLTIAFKKCTEYDSGNMVEVAVNVCSEKDSFSKKLGAKGALEKFFEGETICLPLLRGQRVEDLNFVVKNTFMMVYFLD